MLTGTTSDFPSDPISAVTHPNPYPYYAGLVARPPLYRDDALGLWVATSAEAVASVLNSDLCRVRRVTEPVPKALLGSPAAEIFRRLVRMNDGPNHCPLKQAVNATLASIDSQQALARSAYWAARLFPEAEAADDPARVTDYAFGISVYVLGSFLGIPRDRLVDVAHWMSDFVACIAPGSNAGQIERGKEASSRLWDCIAALASRPGDSLLHVLAYEAERVGRVDADYIIANALGLLSQAYEATAGLIGNTLLALAGRAEIRAQLAAKPELLPALLEEVLRFDAPIQNTRRFVAADGVVAGQRMNAGDTVLVVLAAANRDPATNHDPDRFMIERNSRRVYTFGEGVHACPGDRLTLAIARGAVSHLAALDTDLEALAKTFMYRASKNTRIPLFGVAVFPE